MNPAFFATAETVISRDEAIAAIRNAVPDGTLLWLQTHDDSHEKRLDFTSRMQDVLCTIWNHAPSREALRGVLLTAVRKWLTLAEAKASRQHHHIRWMQGGESCNALSQGC